MFGDDTEEFNLFDDSQEAELNSAETTEDVTDTTDVSSTEDSVSDEDKADDEGTATDVADASDGEETSETESEASTEDKADEAEEAPATASSDQDEGEKFATKEDIRAALAEQQAVQVAQQTGRKTLRSELRSELFPDGIDVDLQIKDSEGGVITGPSQIAGKLINPSTNELFTYEEAKDYWDNAQKKIDRTIEEREQLIDMFAENNQSFYEGSQLVDAKYGTFLKANPEVAQKLLDNYFKLSAKVTKSGYITELKQDVVSYYDDAMAPLLAVSNQMNLQQEAEEAKTVQAKAAQADRADLPVNNNNTPEKKKDELSSAFDRYFEGR